MPYYHMVWRHTRQFLPAPCVLLQIGTSTDLLSPRDRRPVHIGLRRLDWHPWDIGNILLCSTGVQRRHVWLGRNGRGSNNPNRQLSTWCPLQAPIYSCWLRMADKSVASWVRSVYAFAVESTQCQSEARLSYLLHNRDAKLFPRLESAQSAGNGQRRNHMAMFC